MYNNQLLSNIFDFKFDATAPARRLGRGRVSSKGKAVELRRRIEAMSRIRKGVVSERHLTQDLWTVLLMLLENDERNERQLIEWAQLPGFIINFLKSPAQGSSQPNTFESIRSPATSLALWILYILTKLGGSPTFSFSPPKRTDSLFLYPGFEILVI